MKAFCAFSCAVLLASCVGPRLGMPIGGAVSLPNAWRAPSSGSAKVQDAWWQEFDDPILTNLVQRALERNTDLLLAGARVDEARALFKAAASRLSPSVGFDGSGGRSRAVNAFGEGVDPGQIAGEIAVSYEVDLFGRLSASSDAGRKAYIASTFAKAGTRVSMIASVVSGYVLLRGLDEQLLIVEDTLRSRKEELAVIQRRTSSGYGSQLELRQAEAAYEAAARLLPSTKRLVGQQENALSILVGDMPGSIGRGADLEKLLHIALPGAVPSDLLRHRPDVAEAEMRLASTDRSLDAARAQFLPSLQIRATGGGVASTLLTDPISLFSIGGSILAPLFRGGELRAQADAAAARRDAAAYSYRAVVLKAVEETEDAMTAVTGLHDEEVAIDRQVLVAASSLELARRRYRSGYASYLEQIDAERSLLETRLQQVSVRAARLTATVSLYRSLGGGWMRQSASAAGRAVQ